MGGWEFSKGLHEVGQGVFAYLQPDGTWGYSNAGLVTSGGESLLVDTLMGLSITREMLDEMRRKVPAAARIGRLVNTHANPDHVLGNELVEGAEIIAAAKTAEEMAELDPALLERINQYPPQGEASEFLFETMGRKFDLSGATITLPTTTFEQRLSLTVHDKRVELVNLGPAHTKADTIVYVPEDRVVFTGDLLFNEGHPIMWAGPIANWIGACDFIEGLDVEVVVPGHGPVTDKRAVRRLRSYLEFMHKEARSRFDAGLGWEEAARDIAFDEFRHWTDSERVVANVCALYREFEPALAPTPLFEVFAAMQRYRLAHGGHDHPHG